MNKIQQALIGSMGIFISNVGNASDFNINICNIMAQADTNKVLIKPCEGWTSINSCKNNWVVFKLVDEDGNASEGAKAMYSAALLAFTTSSKVALRIVEGHACDGFDVVTLVKLSK